MKLNGARIVIECLKEEKVDVVFGYPGGAIMNVYDEMYKENAFEHILARHEQAAIHCADGYARATGKVGVAIVTSGPGLTNAVTGIATAYTDSIPMVIISGQVPTGLIGSDAFQEIDSVGITRPCSKHNFLVKNVEELARVIKEAFYIAQTGRPGPVHVDVPKDVTAALCHYEYPKNVHIPTYKPTVKGNKRQVKKAVDAITSAKKPLLYIGGGAVLSGASELIREFIEVTQIPAVETLMAQGVMDHNHPLNLGMVGMHGTYAANMAMSETDLVIAFGPRFDDRVTGKLSEFAKNAEVIHIDIDPTSIGKLVNADYPIVGDLKNVLLEMLPEIKNSVNPESYAYWREVVARYDELHPLAYEDSDQTIKPQWVIEEIGRICGEKALISTDVGQHQMWAAQFYPFSFPRQFITSGGLGTMGFGLPAAMGAKRGMPEKVSINITGDGSILMNIQEIITAYEYKTPVVNVILNNNYLGMVRQWQTLFYDDRISETDLSVQPDFVKLAEACGGIGYRVSMKEAFKEALEKAIESKQIAFIDVNVDRRENVLPMVPPGESLKNTMIKIESKEEKAVEEKGSEK